MNDTPDRQPRPNPIKAGLISLEMYEEIQPRLRRAYSVANALMQADPRGEAYGAIWSISKELGEALDALREED